ncbi:MAG TPA: tripartite tricarboxylate transporter substrate-binding protein [Xanthobacteraceae bacterium]|nr:tripartite tricarboxylate transporter substrate-binding protein [Xanthobacteraceae bacterium]
MTRRTMNRRATLLGMAAAGAAPLFAAGPAAAQAKYPDRPIRLIVPYAAGGVVDAVARQWAERIRGPLGTVVIENQGGGGGMIGAGAVARATADGYTLLFGDSSSQIIAPSLVANPPYDAAKDFAAVSIVATSSTSIVVHPSVPVSNFAEFIKYAQSRGNKLSYASAGAGTVTNLAGELFKQLIKTPGIVHVPYRGAGPGLTDLIAGTVPMMTPNVTGQVLDMHRTGKIKILAVCAPARLKAAPEIPAAVETLPGLVVQLAAGVFAPAKTPQPIVAQIAKATGEVIKDPAFIRVLEAAGLEARPDASSAAAEAFLSAERQRLVPIIQAAGLKQN